MPRERGQKVVATNRRARHDYLIEDTYEAGLVLTGTEVKSLREGRASLVDGYAFVDGGEAWLDAVYIPEYLDGTTLFNEEDVDHLPDGLHPDGIGYIRMGERFAATAFGEGGVFNR